MVTFDLHSDLEITPFAGQGSPLIWHAESALIKRSNMAIFVFYTQSIVEMYKKTAKKRHFGDL